ncbi:allophanate hydrolase subunit 2 [Longilinea arvoryzae]|uniref:Allophanate hydrolase subunit 2 n=2 Tax=Longilinea arvoryzae TaxID=360412 RepID=A0A0K8MXD9_9CHLR|nr:allophanate hydrolase subunit 2 [Longilinea arvoryzae]
MLEILSASPFCTIQDSGRAAWRPFGLPAAGPMDPFAFTAANLLLGNPPGAAGIEIGPGELTLRSWDDCLIALAGPGLALRVDGAIMPDWSAVFVPAGSSLQIERSGAGVWGYLAVSGGLQTELIMGSRAAYRPAGLGQAVSPGALLSTAAQPPDVGLRAGATLPPAGRPPYSLDLHLAALPGPHVGRFTPEALAAFHSAVFSVSGLADRTGYRLDGPRLDHVRSGAQGDGADILSAGLLPGCVQVPASGQAVVLMADAPTSGGYTQIASLPALDRALLAQVPPGEGRIRFREVSLAVAQARTQEQWKILRTGIQPTETENLGWAGG